MQAEKELTALLDDVLRLRAAQEEPFRRRFDSLPGFIQRTLFEEEKSSWRRSVDQAKALIEQADDTLRLARESYNKRAIEEALSVFERAVGCVYYIVLKRNAPHWRDVGVRDENFEVCVADDEVAGMALARVGSTLFELERYKECLTLAEFILKNIKEKQARFDAHLVGARAILKLNKDRDGEDMALDHLLAATALNPDDERCITLIEELKRQKQECKRKEESMFKGVLIKPGVRLVLAEEHKDQTKAAVLSETEKEAARQAGLDISDPDIRSVLLNLSKEKDPLKLGKKRTTKKNSSELFWRVFLLSFCAILLIMGLQMCIRSVWLNVPLTEVWRMHLGTAVMQQDSCLDRIELESEL